MDAAEGGRRDLSQATLDTLPINVAVLAEDGRILFTNRGWREFGGQDPTRPPPEATEVNYLAAINPTSDSFASQALEGLEAVLAGDREGFAMEYPCHTPEARQWFLMRVSRFEAAEGTRLVVAHSDITDRKLAEIAAAERAAEVRREREHLEHLLARINGLLEDITHGLVAAGSRGAVDRLVCSRIVEAEPYRAAWIGERDLAADRLVLRESAGGLGPGDGGIDLDATDDPAVAAIDAAEPVVVDPAGPETATWLAGEGAADVAAVAAFPLAVRDVSYGVLVVAADRTGAFDERELAVLSALARATASTVNAIEGRRSLANTAVHELEFAVSDPAFPFLRLAAAAGCPVTFEGYVHRDDGSMLLFVVVEADDADGVAAALGGAAGVEAATVLADLEGEGLLELAVTESVLLTVAEYGGVTTGLEAGGGEARLTVELPHDADARELYATLTERYPGTELVAYRERERPAQTRQGFRSALDERLTERQQTALRSAYLAGYFSWPRTTDGDHLAAAMGVSRPTYHQHLRAALRKLLDGLYATEPNQ